MPARPGARRELYLPRGWCDDPARREEAGIAASVGFATKPALGLRMIERAITAGLPARWVTADEAYGQDSKFRTWLQQHRMGYVLAVPRNQRVPTTAGNSRPDVLAANAPALAWKRRSCGAGAKGPRLYDWAVASLPGTDDGYGHWLLIRRSITRSPGPGGRSRNASRPRRPRSAWTIIRCVATTPGTAT